jgi:periplasmic divalent cation tolerance protein
LEAHLLAEHPWDNPELSAIPIVAGSAGYLRWLDKSTRNGTADRSATRGSV